MDPLAEAVRSIQRNSEQVLQTLIPSKVSPNATVPTIKLNSLTRKNVPLICVAAASGSLEIVKFLIKAGATIDTMQNDGFTAIHWATISGNHMVLAFLIEKLGKKILTFKQNPLILATRYGRTECVKLLLRAGFDLSHTDPAGRSPLHLACWFGHTDIVQLLLQYDVNVDQLDASGKTPLHCCCWFGNRQSEIALIAKKASVNVKDKSDDTPLHLACMHNYGDIVYDLLRAGADPKIKNQLNKTPEEVAEAADHGEIVELLQKKGEAEKKKVGLTSLDKNIVYEQRQMTKTLEDLLSQQEKHADLIKQLRNKVIAQSNNLSATNSQQISLQSKINEMFGFAQQIAEKVDNLLPKNASRRHYQVTRIKSTC